jgi:hypothetical protein
LKTTLVRVSCIQNTQIRGETTAKVFEKVDMFWTYQQQSQATKVATPDPQGSKAELPK